MPLLSHAVVDFAFCLLPNSICAEMEAGGGGPGQEGAPGHRTSPGPQGGAAHICIPLCC